MPSIPFFSKKLPISTKQIEQAIAHLETQTSAELRVVVERKTRANSMRLLVPNSFLMS